MNDAYAVELWYTPSDYSPSYFVRVSGSDVELLSMQDIWPGYPGAKTIKVEQSHIDYIQRDEIKAHILERAKWARVSG